MDLIVIPKLTLTVTNTANGQHNYIQIMSGDNFTVNIVLIADAIDVKDHRLPGFKKEAGG